MFNTVDTIEFTIISVAKKKLFQIYVNIPNHILNAFFFSVEVQICILTSTSKWFKRVFFCLPENRINYMVFQKGSEYPISKLVTLICSALVINGVQYDLWPSNEFTSQLNLQPHKQSPSISAEFVNCVWFSMILDENIENTFSFSLIEMSENIIQIN